MICINQSGGEIVGEIWEWLTRPTHTVDKSTKNSGSAIKSVKSLTRKAK